MHSKRVLTVSLCSLCCTADSDSGSDEEFVSREKMKLTAQAVVDAKTKKKPADDDEAVPMKKRR